MRRDTQPIPELGQRLRERRRLMRMSLSDVETYTGIRASKLSGYENGHATPSLQALLSLCHTYNASPSKLLGWSETVEQQLAGEHDVERSDGRNRLRLMNHILRVWPRDSPGR